MSKDSSGNEEHPHYDIPKNLKPINTYTGDYDVLRSKSESPINEEFRVENNTPESGNGQEIKTTKLSENKLYENLASYP